MKTSSVMRSCTSAANAARCSSGSPSTTYLHHRHASSAASTWVDRDASLAVARAVLRTETPGSSTPYNTATPYALMLAVY